MKRILFACLLPLAFACEVRNEVAQNPENLSAENRIDQNRGDWCQSFCDYRVSCTNTDCDCAESVCYCLETIDMQTCLDGCADYFQDYVGHGEACAQEGLDQMDCVGALNCEQLARGECTPEAEPSWACSGGPKTPPEQATASGLVTCGEYGASGPAPGAASFECTFDALECADGHEYAASCSETQDHQGLCTCFVDQQQGGIFYLPELVCPSEADVNVGCGFTLAPSEGAPEPQQCTGASGGGQPQGAFGCSTEMLCGGHDYSVVCSEDRGYASCDCLFDGTVVQSFLVPDGVCPGGGLPEDMARINAGCGWNLRE